MASLFDPSLGLCFGERYLGGMKNPLWHYHSIFDAEALILRHEKVDRKGDPAFLTNFLGVTVDTKIFPEGLKDFVGLVEGVPIPQNWHADMAEWAAALRAVELSNQQFTMIELGCGWGCWMSATGAAAKRLGREVHMIGVEGDPDHLDFARETMARNAFAETESTFHHGIAAARAGKALFPTQTGGNWGLEPILDATASQVREASGAGSHYSLDMLPIDHIAAGRDRVDLLHIDIQGGEAELIAGAIDVLSRRVAYLVIGTHSRQIEGRLFDILLTAGWMLEVERPAILTLGDYPVPVTHIDGVQGWKNPALFEGNETPPGMRA